MAEFKLYGFGESGNSYKVALMLNLCGLEWEPIFVDFFNGETRSAAYRSDVNEMGEAPVLEHKGVKLSQSGVILDYLASLTGKFSGNNADERREILRWMFFDNHKFTSYFASYRFAKAFGPSAPDPAVMAWLKGRIDAAYGIVDKHLAASQFIVGSKPTIADFSLCGYLFYPVEESGYDTAARFTNIAAWLQRVRALPGWAPPYEMLPGAQIAPKW